MVRRTAMFVVALLSLAGAASAQVAMLTQVAGDVKVSVTGKPWQNGADESFNGKFRNEHLSLQWYRHRVEATVAIEQWRQFFNEVRPHSSLDYRTPKEFKEQITITSGCLGENPEGAVLQE